MQKHKTLFVIILILTIIYIYTIPYFSLAEDSVYVWSNNSDSVQTSAELISTPVSTDPVENNSLNLESESAILIEQSTGQILYAHNIHEQLRPASVTKVMSILLIMEAVDTRKNFTF